MQQVIMLHADTATMQHFALTSVIVYVGWHTWADLSDRVAVRKGRGHWGEEEVKRARQVQQDADHTRKLPSADALANKAALRMLCSSNCSTIQ